MFCTLQKWKYVLLICQNITQTVKKITLFIVPNEKGWHYLAVKKLAALAREMTIFIV